MYFFPVSCMGYERRSRIVGSSEDSVMCLCPKQWFSTWLFWGLHQDEREEWPRLPPVLRRTGLKTGVVVVSNAWVLLLDVLFSIEIGSERGSPTPSHPSVILPLVETRMVGGRCGGPLNCTAGNKTHFFAKRSSTRED